MTAVKQMRARHGEAFERKHQIRLGLMSFFVKATVEALHSCPELNAIIDGDDIIYRRYYDMGVAISSDKGLVVPVLRSAERMSFAQIESAISDLAARARSASLRVDELQGGTFTITNGGIFGSLISTPIVNPPQSGVLGMHTIQDRPVAIDGQVVIRPMMYVALTYDHRIVDGREAVTFLKRVKDTLEDPARLLLEL
jgi:2-oxoglutarate dehydrogenase E2 component (dihydrolipoamide succinyltransferase)